MGHRVRKKKNDTMHVKYRDLERKRGRVREKEHEKERKSEMESA